MASAHSPREIERSSKQVQHDLCHPNGSAAHADWGQSQVLHLAVAYNNPCRWKSRLRLFNDFRRHVLQMPNVRLYVIELAFGDRPFEVTCASNPYDFQYRSREELWHKENLLNIAISQFDDGWEYGGYCDGDFHFTRYDIGLETIHQLQHYDWVQMFSHYTNLGPNHQPIGGPILSATRAFHEGVLNLLPQEQKSISNYGGVAAGQHGAPGGCWAFRRNSYDRCGGLLDCCILGCYDDQTEVFTKRGWIPFAALTMQDKVLSLSPAKVAEWQPVTKLYRYKYDGPMRQIKSQSVDLLVTPNHNMVYEGKDGLYFEKAEEFIHPKSIRSVPKTQTWKGELPKTLPIDVSPEDWAAFIGIWLAEGWTYLAVDKATGSKHYRIGIAQTGADKRKKIAALLKRFPISWFADEHGFIGNHKELFTYLRKLGDRAWEKCVPAEVKNMPTKLLETFLEWYILGDGSVETAKKKNHTDCRRMYTTSEQLRDDVLEILVKTGWWGSYRTQAPRTSKPLKCGRIIEGKRPVYYIWAHRAKTFTLKNSYVTDVAYDGEVFCCETPYHTLLVRRGGKMIWCGNSGDHHMFMGLASQPNRLYPDKGLITMFGKSYEQRDPYARAIVAWQQRAAKVVNGNIGYVEGTAIHHWHGRKAKRGYETRWKVLVDNKFDPYVDIYKDGRGIYCLSPDKPKLRDDIRGYFRSRDEDSNEV